ncbi:MAG: hypothetical protein ACKVH8_10420 [Pirellulales bacterium]
MRLSLFKYALALSVLALPSLVEAQQPGAPQQGAQQARQQVSYAEATAPYQQQFYTGFGQHGAQGAQGAQARHQQPQMPGYAWPAYASHPNYGAVTYPKQHSPAAWPYIGPHYPYPQVPMGWRKVSMEWDDGWWYLDFKARRPKHH